MVQEFVSISEGSYCSCSLGIKFPSKMDFAEG